MLGGGRGGARGRAVARAFAGAHVDRVCKRYNVFCAARGGAVALGRGGGVGAGHGAGVTVRLCFVGDLPAGCATCAHEIFKVLSVVLA